jgi:hypothetical protein
VRTAALYAGDALPRLRLNPHFHYMVLEGAFDQVGKFFYIPFSDLTTMTELSRRRVIQLLVKSKNCINQDEFCAEPPELETLRIQPGCLSSNA